MSYEDLCRRYPALFQQCYDFSIGEGWMPLVETLAARIQWAIDSRRERLAQLERQSERNQEAIDRLAGELRHLDESPPRILQVKEKFGELRFYMSGGLAEFREWIAFAEDYSSSICERCGRRAVRKTRGWVRNLCEEDYQAWLAGAKEQV